MRISRSPLAQSGRNSVVGSCLDLRTVGDEKFHNRGKPVRRGCVELGGIARTGFDANIRTLGNQ
jgi:hypothetical protein